MKLLIDINLSPLWVSFLDFAAANNWIVFTHDLDFGILLAALETNRHRVRLLPI